MNLTFLEKNEIANETVEIKFQRPTAFSFQAGQYVSLTLPSIDQSHDFSLCSSPRNVENLTIAFRVSDSAYKKALLSLKDGDVVEVSQAKGAFILSKETQNVLFIAGGIGITPFLSMILDAAERRVAHKITLFYANNTKEDAAYLEKLKSIEKDNPHFTLFSHFGIVDIESLQQTLHNNKSSLCYICGPPAMVDATRKILTKQGISESQLRIEEFTGY